MSKELHDLPEPEFDPEDTREISLPVDDEDTALLVTMIRIADGHTIRNVRYNTIVYWTLLRNGYTAGGGL